MLFLSSPGAGGGAGQVSGAGGFSQLQLEL